MARRNRNRRPPAPIPGPVPGPAPDPAAATVARAGRATASATLGVAARTRVRNAAPDFRAPAPPWYAMIAFAKPGWRERAFVSEGGSGLQFDEWDKWIERCLRYDVFWSHYEGTVYRKIHQWAEALQVDYDLYSHVRSIFSPAYRIGEFWANHILGGPLDPEAGDGSVMPSSIPIVARNQAIRPVIAQVWRDSNFQVLKDTYPRFGAVLGDVGLMVVDDMARQKVYFRVIHPKSIMDVTRDPFGNVKGYVLSEPRIDPRYSDPFAQAWCIYTEVARRVGDSVEYTTYLDNVPFDWRDYPEGTAESDMVGPVWFEHYGFIPLVMIKNRDFGKGFGWSEFQPDIGKLYELDDIASKLNDQVRKVVDAMWYCTTTQPGDVVVRYDADADGDDGRRTKQPILYGPEGSEMKPLVAPLDIAAVLSVIERISDEIERDHPELASENVSSDASGEARRIARQRAEAMVNQRRATYDDGLVRVHKMAISIGAMREYPGFEAFTGDSFTSGELDHAIGHRPVFATTEADRLADVQLKAQALQALSSAGIPLKASLRMVGYPEDIVDAIMEDAKAEADGQVELDVKRQSGFFSMDADNPPTGTDAGPGSNANQGDVERIEEAT